MINAYTRLRYQVSVYRTIGLLVLYKDNSNVFKGEWHFLPWWQRPREFQTFLCLTRLSMNLILLINNKMPISVDFLTLMSMITG